MSKHQATTISTSKMQKQLALKFLFLLAFVEGAFVIFCELIGAKMLASFFGNSLAVWTAVITTTISFLTFGYFVGGILSKKDNKQNILAILLALAAFFMVVMPSWSVSLFRYFQDSELVAGAILSTLFLIGPAIFCLGTTSPIIIQLINEHYQEPGKSAGQTYAISTVAGVLSTLLLGFYLLPNMGKEVPLFVASITLVVFSVSIKFNYLTIASMLAIFFSALSFVKEDEGDVFFTKLYSSEGMMGKLSVYEKSYVDADIRFRTLFINGIPQTIIYSHQNISNSYWDYVHKMSAFATIHQGGDALLIGMGGAAVASELQQLNYRIDVVDIDKRMFQISKDFFFFTPLSTTNFTENDARNYIKTCKKTYDLIIIDVASGEVQPSNLFTIEGIAELKKILSPNGMVLIQYQEKINPESYSGHLSIAKTFEQNRFDVFANYDYSEIAGIVLVCINKDVVLPAIEKEKLTPNVLAQEWLTEFLNQPFTPLNLKSGNTIILTDDQPRLEQINAETIELWRKKAILNYNHIILK